MMEIFQQRIVLKGESKFILNNSSTLEREGTRDFVHLIASVASDRFLYLLFIT
jgi:hypothetical protein